MEKYNEEAYKDWTTNALDPCPNCDRKFLPDRLVVHLRSCKTRKAEGVDPEMAKKLMPSAKILHEPQEPKEEAKKAKKPKESFAEIIRAAKQSKPKDTSDIEVLVKEKKKPEEKAGAKTVSSASKKAGGGLQQADMERKECPNCARKFALDRFDVHFNICNKKSGGPSSGAKPGFKATFD